MCYDTGEVVAEDKRRVDVALFRMCILMFALSVQDVGMLGAAVRDADEAFVLLGLGDGDAGGFES